MLAYVLELSQTSVLIKTFSDRLPTLPYVGICKSYGFALIERLQEFGNDIGPIKDSAVRNRQKVRFLLLSVVAVPADQLFTSRGRIIIARR
jgi:hypothetical protein